MAEHFLDSSLTHNFWDKSYPPRIDIESGDVVIFECVEGCGGQVTSKTQSNDLSSIDRSQLHALTGPIYINGAEEGDVLEVEVLGFEHNGWGFTYFTPSSLLADEFPAPYIHQWRIQDDACYFKEGSHIVIPFEPFCGIMGVAPRQEDRLITFPPRENGGNIDIRGLGVGAILWLPVWTTGALFSTGDCHAAQGEGEVCGTALECPMKVKFRFNLRKDMTLSELQFKRPSPINRVDTAGYYTTTGHGPNLYENAQNAVRYMIDYLVKEFNLTREEAYVICSVAVDLKISSIVAPPSWIVSAHLPLSVFSS